jgi:hypothetical protein
MMRNRVHPKNGFCKTNPPSVALSESSFEETQSRCRRQQVVVEGTSSCKSCQRAPLLKIQKMPSKTFCACASPSGKYPFYGILGLQLTLGVLMPRYLSQHTLACLTRQGAETLAQRMQGGGPACAERVLVNMVEGKMFAEFRSDSRETLEAWLKTEGMHFDWIVRIEWETREGRLEISG